MRPATRLLAALASTALSLPAQAAGPDRFFEGSGGEPSLRTEAEVPQPGASRTLERRFWVELPASSRDARSAIAGAGVSIEEVSGDSVAGVADRGALDRLERLGVVPLRRDPLDGPGAKGFPPADAAFHDYDEVRAALAAVAGSFPEAASVFSIGSTVQQRDILAIRFNTTAKGEQPSDKPGVVFLGTHHAREHLSTEVPLRLARWLADNRSKPEIGRLLASRDVYFVPLVNPDGAEYDHADCRPTDAPASRGCGYKWQRKNMRANGDGSLGVDLNRNYGFHWGEGGASDRPDSDTYRGPAPFSEPESRAVKRFVEGRPNLKVLLSFHTFSELILYPWGHTYDPIGDEKALAAYKSMASRMAEMTGYKPEQSSDLYIASGDTTDWAWGERGIFSFTFELTPKSMWSGGGFYPGPGVIEPTLERNIGPMVYLLDLANDPYRAAGSGTGRGGSK
ncbi:MAG: zinc carboxypeptidase [Elusimicrobia bacterium]|nr:zinc carboxypeptidase [Elusimicrobiota bacterium]